MPIMDIDEVAYAAYLKALIDGRSRKNDPYTGRDDSDENPQTESLFSIQFASPYLVAIPARIFGISAPTANDLGWCFGGLFNGSRVFLAYWIDYAGLLICDEWKPAGALRGRTRGGERVRLEKFLDMASLIHTFRS